ncbi:MULTISPECIES: ATP-binding protein [unclassified Stygiolobus]|uniref:ATP-binding protein n=1 Tax=unclassified Stygiolobus TaxID=2824672 RepID=UPI00307EA8D4
MSEDISNTIKDKIEKAKALAITLGVIVGRVARSIPNKVDEENYITNVIIDAPTYYKYPFLGKIGVLLGAVDIKSLYFVLLRVVGYERSDVSSLLFSESPIISSNDTGEEEPGSLISNVVVKCEMLTKVNVLESTEPEAADIVIEPQSPVIIPQPEIIERSLDTNRGLLKLGYLDNPSSQVKVAISLDDLNYHMLLLGTTGAGKTSFVKDLIAGIYKAADDTRALIFDATGDYYHIFLPPDRTNKTVKQSVSMFESLYSRMTGIDLGIIYPITKRWLKKYTNGKKDLLSITTAYYKLYVEPIVRYLERKGYTFYVSVDKGRIVISNSEWKAETEIYPFYFRFKEARRILPRLNPYFSEQATQFLKILMKREGRKYESLSDLIEGFEKEDLEHISIHKSTKENILRGLYLLKETGLFDVGAERVPLSNILLNNSKKILVFDLYNSEIDDFSQKILTYYMLDKIFDVREKQMKSGLLKDRIILIVDEAHKFFPSVKGGEEDSNYVRRVAGKIAMMMRLGRRRKIGFIFSTHNPADLSDIIVQLANTKVIFRIKAEVAEAMGLSRSEAKTLSWEKNGVAYLISPWLREGKVKIKVPVPPPLGHYDLSKAT